MENIITVFTGGSSGLFGSESYDVIVTTEGILLVRLSAQMLRAAAQTARETAKERGEGVLGQTASAMKSASTLQERYYTLSREELLTESKSNRFIARNELKAFKIDSINDDSKVQRTVFKIKWTGGNIKLIFSNLDVSQSKKLIRDTFNLKT